MKINRKPKKNKAKRPVSSIFMMVGAAIAAIVGIAALVNNIMVYNKSLTNYVAQGYTKAQVNQQLIPGQLLPAIFEAVVLYGGIAMLLLCASTINTKLSRSLALMMATKEAEVAKEQGSGELENTLNTETKIVEEADEEAVELLEA